MRSAPSNSATVTVTATRITAEGETECLEITSILSAAAGVALDKAERLEELQTRSRQTHRLQPPNSIEAPVICKGGPQEQPDHPQPFTWPGVQDRTLEETHGEVLITWEVRADATALVRHDPPESAEFLLTLFATTRHAESAIGDLNERFTNECKTFGPDRAVRLYWARTLGSLWPSLKRATAKALKWSAVIAMARRMF